MTAAPAVQVSVLDDASIEVARKLGREAPPVPTEALAMLQACGFPFARSQADEAAS